MKLLTLSLFLMTFSAHATRLKVCDFSNGGSHDDSGQVTRTYNPQIVADTQQIDVNVFLSGISITSLMDSSLNLYGVANCDADNEREDFDCYTVEAFNPYKRFYVYITIKKVSLVQYSAFPNKLFQQDNYSCSR